MTTRTTASVTRHGASQSHWRVPRGCAHFRQPALATSRPRPPAPEPGRGLGRPVCTRGARPQQASNSCVVGRMPGRTVARRHRHMFDSAGVHVVATALTSSPRRRRGSPRPARQRLPVVARRATQHGLVLTAVAVTVLLCATAMAALAALAGSSVQAGAVQRLAADLDAQVSASASFRAGGMAAADRDVRAAAERVFAGVPQRTYVGLLGTSPLSVTGVDGAGPPRGPGGSGLHPGRGAGRGQVRAVGCRAVARRHGRRPGRRLHFAPRCPARHRVHRSGRRGGARRAGQASGRQTRFQPSGGGRFRARHDPADHRRLPGDRRRPSSKPPISTCWWCRRRLSTAARPLNGQQMAHWSVQPDFSRIDAGSLPGLHDRLRAFSGSQSRISVWRGRQPSLDDLTVSSGLPGAIEDLKVPMVAAPRSASRRRRAPAEAPADRPRPPRVVPGRRAGCRSRRPTGRRRCHRRPGRPGYRC